MTDLIDAPEAETNNDTSKDQILKGLMADIRYT